MCVCVCVSLVSVPGGEEEEGAGAADPDGDDCGHGPHHPVSTGAQRDALFSPARVR